MSRHQRSSDQAGNGNDGGNFQARQSKRMQEANLQADGDSWQETLAVCESPPPGSKLIIRSFYQNTRTGKRVWDEPPSGASKIMPASDEMRRMAQIQLRDMQVVVHPVEDAAPASASSSSAKDSKKNKRGFFGFRKKKDKKKPEKTEERVIQYKKGSQLRSNAGRPSQGARTAGDIEDDDFDMQAAIAQSIAESQGIPHSETAVIKEERSRRQHEAQFATADDEELAMAKALSLSEAEARGGHKGASEASASQQGGGAPNVGDLLGDFASNSKPAAATVNPNHIHHQHQQQQAQQRQHKQIPLTASSQRKAPPPSSVAAQPQNHAGPSPSVTPNYASHQRTVLSVPGNQKGEASPPRASPSQFQQPKSPGRSSLFDPYHKDNANDATTMATMATTTNLKIQSIAPASEPSSSASFPSPNTISRKKRLQMPNLGGGTGGRSGRSSKVQEQAGLV
mmetsp:Transcript_17440/g.49270  ORF Transcript_17440/g.49270 Transcript_17440/m.49270 type:complete len:453 (-) Transcript_17440:76-1434(-)|eukprot:CAMPEP_0119560934 /NCGR_PEP_ID=MMETSP1352-20130426/16221_1 /TAXON_ID=265584 /ORGANISM="Stauroneis constricta, Strain CCMP1120" /LENGTH=452 /DNA_ID=CAMNT_0007609013 /DNA_START=499 /DNA_END=1857 /DNA_ORIENTATION=-